MIYLILALAYVLFDQLTKWLIVGNIPYASGIKICDCLNIVHVTNTGVAFSMFQGVNHIFSILTLLVVSGVIIYIFKYKHELTKLQIHAMILVVAGGIGNLTDRIFRGAVIDFIDVGYKNIYRWPSFNFADSCVCIGVALFIISMLFQKKDKQ